MLALVIAIASPYIAQKCSYFSLSIIVEAKQGDCSAHSSQPYNISAYPSRPTRRKMVGFHLQRSNVTTHSITGFGFNFPLITLHRKFISLQIQLKENRAPLPPITPYPIVHTFSIPISQCNKLRISLNLSLNPFKIYVSQ